MKVFSVELGSKKFELIGIADIFQKTVNFQAVINNVPFAQNEDYEIARALLMDAVMLNKPETHKGVQ